MPGQFAREEPAFIAGWNIKQRHAASIATRIVIPLRSRAVCVLIQQSGELEDRRRGEYGVQRNRFAELSANRRVKADSLHGLAANFKEIVVQADLLAPKGLGP